MKPKFEKQYYSNLFSWKELEYLINIRPLMTDQRVYLQGDENHQWNNSGWALDVSCYPPSLLKQLIEENLCYLRDMSRCSEKINTFNKSIEEEYKVPTDAHIYICRNPSLHHPFGIHFDMNHNIIVQCEGESNFKVWEHVRNKRIKNNNLSLDTNDFNPHPILNVDMIPGDAIWIPAYHPHLATSKTSRMSVSFPIPPVIRDDVVFEDREWIKL